MGIFVILSKYSHLPKHTYTVRLIKPSCSENLSRLFWHKLNWHELYKICINKFLVYRPCLIWRIIWYFCLLYLLYAKTKLLSHLSSKKQAGLLSYLPIYGNRKLVMHIFWFITFFHILVYTIESHRLGWVQKFIHTWYNLLNKPTWWSEL